MRLGAEDCQMKKYLVKLYNIVTDTLFLTVSFGISFLLGCLTYLVYGVNIGGYFITISLIFAFLILVKELSLIMDLTDFKDDENVSNYRIIDLCKNIPLSLSYLNKEEINLLKKYLVNFKIKMVHLENLDMYVILDGNSSVEIKCPDEHVRTLIGNHGNNLDIVKSKNDISTIFLKRVGDKDYEIISKSSKIKFKRILDSLNKEQKYNY